MITRLASKIDLYLMAVLLIALVAAWPLVMRPGLPRHTDLELHVFRAAEFRRVLEARPFEYPRWAPNFYYGYGYPIFNYYAPLTYYAASVLTWLPGLDSVAAMKLVLVVTFVLAASGTYSFARRHFGSAGGVVASAAYTFSPYILFIDPFTRGDAAEFLALGLLPWVFLAFDRPLTTPRAIGSSALALAAIVFSHNLMALMAAGLLGVWLVWRGLLVDGVGRWPRDLAAIGLTLGITAVFWLPFIAERGAVRLDVAGPGHFDFRNHFVDLGALLRPSPILDLGATSPHFIYNLGLPQWALALLAFLALNRMPRPVSRIVVFFILSSCLLVFLVTPASQFAWEAVPPAAVIQFPWRFLGPAAFTLAMCAGGGVAGLASTRFRRGALSARYLPSIALVAVLAFALPTMYPPAWNADFGDVSAQGSIDFELSGVALGTTSTGDFLPVTVTQTPPAARSVLDSYRAGRVDRFDYGSASGARVDPIRLSDLDVEYAVKPVAGFTARFFVFAFPGWQAMVDGLPVASRPGKSDGFIQFEVPASSHSFGIRFESTPARTVGAVVSLAGTLVVIALFVAPFPARRGPIVVGTGQPVANFHSAVLVILLVAFMLVRVVVFDRCDTCFRYTSPPGQALAASNQQTANFAGHIDLLGFDISKPEVQPGESIPLTLYWRATEPVPVNYQVFAHLVRPDFVLWGQSDKLNPGDFPSTRWPLDRYVWDDHRLRVLPGTPPGDYNLVVGLYTLGDGRRAPVLDASGGIAGDSVQLSLPVHVAPALQPPSLESLGIQVKIERREEGLRLLGASIEQAVLPRPNFARLTLFWQAQVDSPADRMVRAQLVDRAGHPAGEIATSPTGGAYPPPTWRSGEIVRDIYAFWLPPEFPPGVYTVRVSVEGDEQAIDIGQIEVIP
jgi:hypothetical protein